MTRGTDTEAPAITDAVLQAQIERARTRTLAWLDAMQTPGLPDGVARISAAHDPARWPGMLLPGTYNGVMCRSLLDGLSGVTADARMGLVDWLQQHRRRDGIFRVPGMTDADVYKKADLDETWRYIDFHVTNYALGAVEALDPGRAPLLTFARPWLDPLTLKAWLSDRNLRDPAT